jgi:hypothetical protein
LQVIDLKEITILNRLDRVDYNRIKIQIQGWLVQVQDALFNNRLRLDIQIRYWIQVLGFMHDLILLLNFKWPRILGTLVLLLIEVHI